MKLSEFKGEEAVEVLADLIVPFSEICKNKESIKNLFKGENKAQSISTLLKEHKKSVVEILAILDREDPNKYDIDVITATKKILELLNDESLLQLFR